MTNIFEQNIGDSSVLGKEETGVLTDRIYEILYFLENDSSNCVIYYPNTDSNHDAIFNLDFASEYINSIINVTCVTIALMLINILLQQISILLTYLKMVKLPFNIGLLSMKKLAWALLKKFKEMIKLLY